ncbi:hypothetical protein [Pseudomonas sp. B22129]|uniref:hypothetical protein n=1 Tax=Pseudomonas sp. B22129 TaxID=3235111 RepID=UPI003784448E
MDKPVEVKPVDQPVALPTIRFGLTHFAVGNDIYSNFRKQMQVSSNYGEKGTYNKIQAVAFFDALPDLVSSTLTAAQLKEKYDVLFVGVHVSSLTSAHVPKLKEFLSLKGCLILAFEHTPNQQADAVLKQFEHGAATPGYLGNLGGVGVFAGTEYNGSSSSKEGLSNCFGDTLGVPLKGTGAMIITEDKLSAGSKVIASSGNSVLMWLMGGTKGRAVAFSDIDLLAYDFAGDAIDTGQKKFFHNMVAYIFDQVLAAPQS